MSSPAIKIIDKEVKLEDCMDDDKAEEQIIQISVSNDPNPVQIFSPVPIVGLKGTENPTIDPHNTIITPVSLPVVQFELGTSDHPTPTSELQVIEPKIDNTEDNVFMIPPLLRVRQFAIRERLPISIEEIRRRIGPPESLSQALILSLLRLNKERAKHLKKALSQFGITELPNRSAVVSSFSRLSEAEAQGLGEDYYYLASRFMKVKTMHQTLMAQHGGDSFFAPKATGTKAILEQILAQIEKRDSDLNLLTHGFSPLILRAVFNILIEILTYKEMEKDLIFDTPDAVTL